MCYIDAHNSVKLREVLNELTALLKAVAQFRDHEDKKLYQVLHVVLTRNTFRSVCK